MYHDPNGVRTHLQSADVRRLLRDIYDEAVEKRERKSPPVWENEQRDAFLHLLQRENKRSLLEVGTATGVDAVHFQTNGLDVVCTDLSEEMVRRCREKGLAAHVMDVCDLTFPPASFDAVFAQNCLIHVPKAEWPQCLAGIARVLKPGGLFYLALYGGQEFEGVWDGDSWGRKRFFSFHTDAGLRRFAEEVFDVHSFEQVPQGWGGMHYQSLVLRKPETLPG